MIFWIALGGGIGAVLRYATILLCEKYQRPFYVATFIVNVVGSFFMGIMVAMIFQNQSIFAFITVGVLGGYTTFSTFAFDLVRLLQQRKQSIWFMYAFLTLLTSFGAFLGGIYIESVM